MTDTAVRVEIVREADARGELAELYDELRELFLGFVPDVFELVSTRPDRLRHFIDGHRTMFEGGVLPREAKEVIALTVARVGSCQYCATAHDTILRLLGTDAAYADAVLHGDLDHPASPTGVRALAELAHRSGSPDGRGRRGAPRRRRRRPYPADGGWCRGRWRSTGTSPPGPP